MTSLCLGSGLYGERQIRTNNQSVSVNIRWSSPVQTVSGGDRRAKAIRQKTVINPVCPNTSHTHSRHIFRTNIQDTHMHECMHTHVCMHAQIPPCMHTHTLYQWWLWLTHSSSRILYTHPSLSFWHWSLPSLSNIHIHPVPNKEIPTPHRLRPASVSQLVLLVLVFLSAMVAAVERDRGLEGQISPSPSLILSLFFAPPLFLTSSLVLTLFCWQEKPGRGRIQL